MRSWGQCRVLSAAPSPSVALSPAALLGNELRGQGALREAAGPAGVGPFAAFLQGQPPTCRAAGLRGSCARVFLGVS